MAKISVDSDLKEIMPEFLLHLTRELELVNSMFNKQEAQAICRFAHRLKGDAPGYGLNDLGRLAEQLEASARLGNLKPTYQIFERIRTYLASIEIVYSDDL